MPLRSAKSASCSNSTRIVRPASIASTRAPAARNDCSVPTPIVGMSNRRSCWGFATFTTTMPPVGQRRPARRMHSSVPSIASSAIGARFFTTTVCPMSSRPSSLASRQPKITSCSSADESGRPAITPSAASNSGAKSVAGQIRTPSASNAELIAPRSESSRLSRCRVTKCGQKVLRPVQSGRWRIHAPRAKSFVL